MEKVTLQKYKNDSPAHGMRRFKALVIDGLVLMVLSFALILCSTQIVSTFSSYKESEKAINSEMIACYKIEEKAKIHEFIGEGDEKYQHPRNLEDIFEDYCLKHILLSYSKDAEPFTKYGVTVTNPDNLPLASYETDNLAYFYATYVKENNTYKEQENTIVDFGENEKLYFYKRLKENSPKIDMWKLDEVNYELPYLDSYFACDLYKYLFVDDDYQVGLTNYNYLATAYKAMWEEEVDLLTNSVEFKEHFDVYLENYGSASYMVDGAIVVAYILSFFIAIIVPQFFFKNSKTIGKKVANISVVDDEGYEANLAQIIFRNIFLFFANFGFMIFPCFLAGGLNSGWTFPLFQIGSFGVSMFAIMILTLFASLISFILIFLNKNRKSLHDFICKTICIDDRYHMDPKEAQVIYNNENKKEFDSLQVDMETEVIDSETLKKSSEEDLDETK